MRRHVHTHLLFCLCFSVLVGLCGVVRACVPACLHPSNQTVHRITPSTICSHLVGQGDGPDGVSVLLDGLVQLLQGHARLFLAFCLMFTRWVLGTWICLSGGEEERAQPAHNRTPKTKLPNTHGKSNTRAHLDQRGGLDEVGAQAAVHVEAGHVLDEDHRLALYMGVELGGVGWMWCVNGLVHFEGMGGSHRVYPSIHPSIHAWSTFNHALFFLYPVPASCRPQRRRRRRRRWCPCGG